MFALGNAEHREQISGTNLYGGIDASLDSGSRGGICLTGTACHTDEQLMKRKRKRSDSSAAVVELPILVDAPWHAAGEEKEMERKAEHQREINNSVKWHAIACLCAGSFAHRPSHYYC